MEFGLLGSLLVRDETGSHVVGAAKQRIVLAALLLRPGQVVTVDALAETLWDGRPPKSATASVRTYVMRLRNALGPAGQRVSGRSGGYLAEVGAEELDLLRFEQLRARGTQALQDGAVDLAATLLGDASALWRGPALADVPSDTLHRDECPRLAESRLGTLELKLEAEIRLGRYAPAIAELRGLTGAHPERERLWAQLMTALYRDGRQSEALAAYRRVRRVLAEEIGAEPGPGLRELHRRILTADPALEWPPVGLGLSQGMGSSAGAGLSTGVGLSMGTGSAAESSQSLEAVGPQPGAVTAAGPAVIPFQIPADLPDFTGRACDADDLIARLTARDRTAMAGGPATTVLTGPPGIGKSALAVHVAHAVRGHFPDGTLYADLRGSSPIPAQPQAVLGSFLRALGRPAESIPSGPDDRAGLLRSVLADRRVLIVLDDAADGAQVGPLLPGTAASAALITGQRRLADLPAGQHLELDPLTPREAAQLLGRIVGQARAQAEPSAVADLAAACDRLPLALRIAGARLAARPRWRVRDLADRIAAGHRHMDELVAGALDIRSRLAPGYRSLSPASARAFRLVALLDVPIVRTSVAAAALDTGLDQAERLMEDLVDAHLLGSSEPGCYSYLGLVRTFARELAHELDPGRERTRVVDRATRALLAHKAPVLPPAYVGRVVRVAFSPTTCATGAADAMGAAGATDPSDLLAPNLGSLLPG